MSSYKKEEILKFLPLTENKCEHLLSLCHFWNSSRETDESEYFKKINAFTEELTELCKETLADLKPKPRAYWINIYKSEITGKLVQSQLHKSREKAIESSEKNPDYLLKSHVKFIKTIEVEI